MGNEENKPRIRVVSGPDELAKVLHDMFIEAGDEAAAADFAKMVKTVRDKDDCTCEVCSLRRALAAEKSGWVPPDVHDTWVKRAQEAEDQQAKLRDQVRAMADESRNRAEQAAVVRAENAKLTAVLNLRSGVKQSDVINLLIAELYRASQSQNRNEVIAKTREMLVKIMPLAAYNVIGSVIPTAKRAECTYITGPMTGYAEHNFPAFNAAAKKLRDEGRTVINPADHGVVTDAKWDDYLRADIEQMMRCTHIYLLKGWEKSQGALLEFSVAEALGFTIEFEA